MTSITRALVLLAASSYGFAQDATQEPTMLTIVGGNNQYASIGTFNSQPFDIAVWNAAGTAPLINASVSFSVLSGGGLLASSNDGAPVLSSSLVLETDSDGTVQAFYKQPGVFSPGQVVVTAGSAQLVLYTHSLSSLAADDDGDGLGNSDELMHGTSPVSTDSDGDGLPDGWEVTYLLNPLVNESAADSDGDGVPNLAEYKLGRNPQVAAVTTPAVALGLVVTLPR